MGVLAAPGVAVYILMTDWRVITRWRVLLGVGLAVVIGISINYLFLPIRAGQFPPINEGEPIGFFSTALSEVLGPMQYAKPSVFERQADFSVPGEQLPPVLRMAIRARLALLLPGADDRVLGLGLTGLPDAAAEGPSSRIGGADPLRDADRGSRLLPQFPLRVLDRSGQQRPGPRGPRARLLLHRLASPISGRWWPSDSAR